MRQSAQYRGWEKAHRPAVVLLFEFEFVEHKLTRSGSLVMSYQLRLTPASLNKASGGRKLRMRILISRGRLSNVVVSDLHLSKPFGSSMCAVNPPEGVRTMCMNRSALYRGDCFNHSLSESVAILVPVSVWCCSQQDETQERKGEIACFVLLNVELKMDRPHPTHPTHPTHPSSSSSLQRILFCVGWCFALLALCFLLSFAECAKQKKCQQSTTTFVCKPKRESRKKWERNWLINDNFGKLARTC